MLKIEYHSQFKKDYKLAVKRGCDITEFQKVVSLLVNEQPLPEKCHDHKLTNSNRYKDVRECHIGPGWLLIYKVHKDSVIMKLIRMGDTPIYSSNHEKR